MPNALPSSAANGMLSAPEAGCQPETAMMDRPIDLRGTSVADVIRFVFEHPVPLGGDKEWFWRLDRELEFDPAEQISHFRHILQSASSLHPRFSVSQIEQGFWFMFGPGGDAYFARLLADEAIPWPARSSCIEAIYDAYAGLFAREPLEEAPYMLWDMLLHAWWG